MATKTTSVSDTATYSPHTWSVSSLEPSAVVVKKNSRQANNRDQATHTCHRGKHGRARKKKKNASQSLIKSITKNDRKQGRRTTEHDGTTHAQDCGALCRAKVERRRRPHSNANGVKYKINKTNCRACNSLYSSK